MRQKWGQTVVGLVNEEELELYQCSSHTSSRGKDAFLDPQKKKARKNERTKDGKMERWKDGKRDQPRWENEARLNDARIDVNRKGMSTF